MTSPESPGMDRLREVVTEAIDAVIDGWMQGDPWLDDERLADAVLAALLPVHREMVLTEAAHMILDHRDRHFPADGNDVQRRARRILQIAVQVVSPTPTREQLAEKLMEMGVLDRAASTPPGAPGSPTPTPGGAPGTDSTRCGRQPMPTPEPIVTVTPTIMSGTVLRWYHSEDAALYRREALSASRDGVIVNGFLTDIPATWLSDANHAHFALRAGRVEEAERYATHRMDLFGRQLKPLAIDALPGTDTKETSDG